MHKHAASTIEAFLDETIGGHEVLEQVLVLDIIDVNDKMLERLEKIPIWRQPQDREDMGDVSVVQLLLASQGKQSGVSRERESAGDMCENGRLRADE